MKNIQVYVLFLLFAFYTSCKPNKLTKDNISKGLYSGSQLKEAASSSVPMSIVRNVKQAGNGDILIASYLGMFQSDGIILQAIHLRHQ